MDRFDEIELIENTYIHDTREVRLTGRKATRTVVRENMKAGQEERFMKKVIYEVEYLNDASFKAWVSLDALFVVEDVLPSLDRATMVNDKGFHGI